jgi:hypothetical protein
MGIGNEREDVSECVASAAMRVKKKNPKSRVPRARSTNKRIEPLVFKRRHANIDASVRRMQ